MKLVSAMFAVALIAPALVVAVALGPVILGVLCAVGCALLVMAVVDLLVGIGWAARSAGRSGTRFARSHR